MHIRFIDLVYERLSVFACEYRWLYYIGEISFSHDSRNVQLVRICNELIREIFTFFKKYFKIVSFVLFLVRVRLVTWRALLFDSKIYNKHIENNNYKFHNVNNKTNRIKIVEDYLRIYNN